LLLVVELVETGTLVVVALEVCKKLVQQVLPRLIQ
jgi:hypothetical protein